ncbi:hypothetical protein [Spirosoma endbachense]|uniref:HTH araC/xylS-type domain-containing protein n=1 Tax=Spirosoma endbachense TaxID=2666025 RepID=A0A6P1VQA7_9BACT|nr:hypothetical protein [Spirosoma endbachense]QHV94302.1 hypothetical protein GJR95_04380 [Spirosoma endbachense]
MKQSYRKRLKSLLVSHLPHLKEFGVSKTSLFQKIKSITGQSIVEFIRTFRLKNPSSS